MKVYAVVTNAATDCGHMVTESIWSTAEAAHARARQAEAEWAVAEWCILYAEVKEFEVDPITGTRPTGKDS